jgi:hypothetical protein
VTAGKAAGDPVRLVNRMARGADVGVIQQIEQLSERATRAMGSAFRRRNRADACGLPNRAGIVVHQAR